MHGPTQNQALLRSALSTLLGTREAIDAIERELLLALALHEAKGICGDTALLGVNVRTVRLSGVNDGLWNGLIHAAVGVESNILTVLGQGAPNRASRLVDVIEVAKDCLADRSEAERDEFLLLIGESPSSDAAGRNGPAASTAGRPQPVDRGAARPAASLMRGERPRRHLRGIPQS